MPPPPSLQAGSYAVDTASLGASPPPVPTPAPPEAVRSQRELDPVERRRELLRRLPPLPHEQTFASIYGSAQNVYRSYSDEATIRNWQDALAMRRNDFLHGLLRHRQLPVVGLPHHLEVDNPRDEGQKQVAAHLSSLIDAIPHFQDLKLALSEAVWYGKAGVQLGVGRVTVDGQPRTGILLHEPINGDKIVFRFDAYGRTPGVLLRQGWTPPRPQDAKYIRRADRGSALFLCDPFYRDRFIIHRFEPTDFDYLFEGEKAAGVHGTGLRDRIYWAWWLREELLSYAMDALQRLSTMGLLYWEYQSGNPRDLEAGLDALRMLVRDSVAAVPRQQGQKDGDAIKHIDISPVGYDILLKFINYIDDNIRRCVLGQDATSGGGQEAGGPAKTAEAQESTFDSIKRFDANALGETLTSQLLRNLVRWNYPQGLPFGVRLKFPMDREDVGERAAAIKMAFDMQLPMSRRQVYEALGVSPPEDAGDELVPPQPDPMGMMGGPGGGPGGPQGGPPPGQPQGGPPKPGGPSQPGGPGGPVPKPPRRLPTPAPASSDGSGIPGGANVPSVLRQAAADRPGSGTPRVLGGIKRHARELPEGRDLERLARRKPAPGQGSFAWSEQDHPRGQPENAGEFIARGEGAAALAPEAEAPLEAAAAEPTTPADPMEAAAADWKANGVRSGAFKAWFGDWEADPGSASKAVDEQTGEPQENFRIPLPVFHGTNSDFDSFSYERFGKTDHGFLGRGFYFTNLERVAHWYAIRHGGEGKVLSAYLNVRNPYILEKKPAPGEPLPGFPGGLANPEDSERFAASLKSQGYDGVYARRTGEWVVFDPTQIKSVDNAGTFDPGDPRMRYARKGKPAAGQGSFAWSEEDHPRGQPENAGEFVARGEGAAAPAPKAEAPTESTPAEPADPKEAAAADWKANGVRSAAFKAWFGPWDTDPAAASKVVDAETGEPRETHPIPGDVRRYGVHPSKGFVAVPDRTAQPARGPGPRPVYHGTPRGGFDRFDPGRIQTPEAQFYGPGFYFAEDRDVADAFQDRDRVDDFAVGPEGARALNDFIAAHLPAGWRADAEGWSGAGRTIRPVGESFNRFTEHRDIPEALGWDEAARADWERAVDRAVPTFERPATVAAYLNIRNPFDADDQEVRLDELPPEVREKLTAGPMYAFFRDEKLPALRAQLEGMEAGKPRSKKAKADLEATRAEVARVEEQLRSYPLDYVTLASHVGGKVAANALLRRAGYDGITFQLDDPLHRDFKSRSWVAFEPTQVKSTDNAGTFDPTDPRMRYARKGKPAAGQGSFAFGGDDAGPGIRHAPAGGVAVGGTTYPGGEFIPGEAVARASPAEKAELEAKTGQPVAGAQPPATPAAAPTRDPAVARLEQAAAAGGDDGFAFGSFTDADGGTWQVKVYEDPAGVESPEDYYRYHVNALGPDGIEHPIGDADTPEQAHQLADSGLADLKAEWGEAEPEEPEQPKIDHEAIEAAVRAQPLPADLAPAVARPGAYTWTVGGRNADGEAEELTIRVRRNPRADRGEAPFLLLHRFRGDDEQSEGHPSAESAQTAARGLARDWLKDYTGTAYDLAVQRAIDEAEGGEEEGPERYARKGRRPAAGQKSFAFEDDGPRAEAPAPGENCGTGAGGFRAGNTCATGGRAKEGAPDPARPRPGDVHEIPARGDRMGFHARVHRVDPGTGQALVALHHPGEPDPEPGAEPTWATPMPIESVRHFVNDLRGVVDVPPTSGHPAVDAVARGEGEFLGKGDDGLVFRVGDRAVKVSTTVPFQPFNRGHRTPREAADQLERQHRTAEALRQAGVPGIPEAEFLRHGDKGFEVRPYLDMPETLTAEQVGQVRDALKGLHAAGHALNDQLQVGVGPDGRAYLSDLGKAGPIAKFHTGETSADDDASGLRSLAERSGVPHVMLPQQALNVLGFARMYAKSIARDPEGKQGQLFLGRLAGAREALARDEPDRLPEVDRHLAEAFGQAFPGGVPDAVRSRFPAAFPEAVPTPPPPPAGPAYAHEQPFEQFRSGAIARLMDEHDADPEEIAAFYDDDDFARMHREAAEQSRRQMGADWAEGHDPATRNPSGVFSDKHAGPRYTYGLNNRPAGMGATPKGPILDSATPPGTEGYRHGTISYPFPLTPGEVSGYELTPHKREPGARPASAPADDRGMENQPTTAAPKAPHELTRADLIAAYTSPPANNSLTPWEGTTPPVGSWRIEDPHSGEMEQLREFDPHELHLTEGEGEVRNRDDYQQYVDWARQGKQPPPITVVRHADGHLVAVNRRRVMAAREAGVPKIAGWFSDSLPSGRPAWTHRGMVEQALKEGKAVPPEVLADYPDLQARAAPTPPPAPGGPAAYGLLHDFAGGDHQAIAARLTEGARGRLEADPKLSPNRAQELAAAELANRYADEQARLEDAVRGASEETDETRLYDADVEAREQGSIARLLERLSGTRTLIADRDELRGHDHA